MVVSLASPSGVAQLLNFILDHSPRTPWPKGLTSSIPVWLHKFSVARSHMGTRLVSFGEDGAQSRLIRKDTHREPGPLHDQNVVLPTCLLLLVVRPSMLHASHLTRPDLEATPYHNEPHIPADIAKSGPWL
ncbi:hypothetical protein VNO77_43970 [Canavalia gladiata]|uniref:Uncharacterized protein n=1 Tax=Canavalia gladiata TaxID=3824 RepID=A0AAN9JVX0_CANGL